MTDIEELHKNLKNMLFAFHEFCVGNNLTYYIIGGTLLGAVRHKGFIPWDDDIDVGMPLEDYNKLQELSGKINDYEFVSRKTNEEFQYGFVKMYNPNTTFVESFESCSDAGAVGGLYIDVFPLIGMGGNFRNAENYMKYIFGWRSVLYYKQTKGKKRTRIKQLAAEIIRKFPIGMIFKKLDKLTVRHNYESSKYIANFYGTYGKKEVSEKAWFGKPTLYNFEDIKVNGPEMANEYLTRIYGDYMKLPPVDKRHVHTFSYCNFDLPYREYNTVKENAEKK